MSAPTRRLAAIDIGTVTCRLLVADVGEGGIAELARRTDITHLGEGLAASGTLSEAAMSRVSDAVSGYVDLCRELAVERIEAVATSAARDASNSDRLLAMLARYEVTPRILAGSREAYLSFLGATSHIDAGVVLIDDIGGGSTELVLGSAHGAITQRVVDIESARSLDVGSRRITEMFLHSDPPTRSELAAARSFCAQELRPFFDALKQRPRTLISVAGTATSIVSVLESMEPYDPALVHGTVVSGAQVAEVLEMLAALPLDRRSEVRGLHPQRAGVIVAGVLILETVMALSGLDCTIVSEHDILYGILLDAFAGGLT